MKVVHVIDSLGGGGAERSVLELVVELRRQGVDASLVALVPAAEGFEEDAVSSGLPFTVLPAGGVVARLRSLRAVLRDVGADVVHATLPVSVVLAGVASIGTGTVLVTTLTAAVPPALERRLFRRRGWRPAVWLGAYKVVTRLRARRIHAITAGTAEVESRRWSVRADRTVVVERGRDLQRLGRRTDDRRARVRASIGVGSAAPLVVVGARVSRQKHLVVLLQAFASVLERLPDAQLVIVGRFDDDTEVVQRAAGPLVAAGSVRLLGFRNDFPDVLAAADATALTSLIEGGAGVLIEAMGLGVPIVSTEIDGLRSVLVPGENALVVPQGDIAGFADQLVRVLTDGELAERLARHGRRTFDERFTIEGAASGVIDLYREACGRVA